MDAIQLEVEKISAELEISVSLVHAILMMENGKNLKMQDLLFLQMQIHRNEELLFAFRRKDYKYLSLFFTGSKDNIELIQKMEKIF